MEKIKNQFSILNLPSKGLYYPNKNGFILIKYLTSIEEHILADSMLMSSEMGIDMVLKNVIMSDFVDFKKMLVSDFQSILIFLRSTAYNDNIKFKNNCPHCNKENEKEISLSQLEFKKPLKSPNSDGTYIFTTPQGNKIVTSPMTMEKEMNKQINETDADFFIFKDDDGSEIKVRKNKTLSLIYGIDSINEKYDKNEIRTFIKKMTKKEVDYISNFIEDNSIGVQEKLSFTCDFCENEFNQRIDVGYNFLSLPEEYKQNILDECFSITYYGKGFTHNDTINMPVYERKWVLRRINEEVEKRNESEKQAMSKAKRNK